MIAPTRCALVLFAVVGALMMAIAPAAGEEPKAQDELTEFTSKDGRFSILLPGEPRHKETKVGDAGETQHQFQAGTAAGVYLVSYQENPNLEGSSNEELLAALESGRDRMLTIFEGKLVENRNIELEHTDAGLSFRLTMPKVKGEARCNFYMDGTRLYQVMAMGYPDFVGSEPTTKVLESFKVLP